MFEASAVLLLVVVCVRLVLSISTQNFQKSPFSERRTPEKVPDELQQILNSLLSTNHSYKGKIQFQNSFNERRAPEKVPPELQQILNSVQSTNRPILEANLPITGADPCDCGIKGANRIVGGAKTGVTEWPWQAYLYIDKTYMCGGTLITSEWILTAGHCIFRAKQVAIFLGVYNLNYVNQAKHITTASLLKVHESYDENTVRNDLALLKLTTPVPAFSTYIKPVCLPYKYSSTDFQGKLATVIGWGRTSEGGSISMTLREVQMTVLNKTQCTKLPYRITPTDITDNNFCLYKTGADSCQGDSGGPVNWQATTADRTYQIGIVSWGVGCARKYWPGVYTRVTAYLSWIDTTTGSLTIFPENLPVNATYLS